MTAKQALRRLGRLRRLEREMIYVLERPMFHGVRRSGWEISGERQHRAQLAALDLAVATLRGVYFEGT